MSTTAAAPSTHRYECPAYIVAATTMGPMRSPPQANTVQRASARSALLWIAISSPCAAPHATPLAAPATPADFSSYPLRINESGHIVGYSNDSVHGFRAVRWDANGIHFLNPEIGAGPDLRLIAAYDINVLGEIAGELEEGTLKKGFLLSP